MADIELVIKIPEEKLYTIKNKMYCGIYDPGLYKAIANGIPLEEELHREKEQAYYLGYEDGRKSEWTAVAESEPHESEGTDADSN